MSKVSKMRSAGEPVEGPGIRGSLRRARRLHVGFETYTADADLAPLFEGLPDDRCQCPHWGYVLRGKLVYHTRMATT